MSYVMSYSETIQSNV